MENFTNKRSNRWILSLLSGLLMVIAFPKTGSLFPLTFVSFVPLLLVEHYYSKNQYKGGIFIHAYLTFFSYNLGTTWWIVYASEGGAAMAFFANSLLMAIAFWIFHLVKRNFSSQWHFACFAAVWLTFEWLHFHWELSWPWLTYGNVFASIPEFVQWYSITGVFGGTLWILGLNYLIFRMIINDKLKQVKAWGVVATVLVLPIAISLIQFSTKETNGTPYTITVLQPNQDPYETKFSASNEDQLNQLFALADRTKTDKTQLLVAPETALYPNPMSYSDYLIVDELNQHSATRHIRKYQEKNRIPLLIGGSTMAFYLEEHSAASDYEKSIGRYVESYNSSLLFNPDKQPNVVHKSHLVLGVEKIPFISTLPFLKRFAIDLGGSSGSLGIADQPSVMSTGTATFAPVVCYESIYGEFIARQTIQYASFIAVITNDGWWRDTPGYKQHFLFSGLRAIENDKWVVRSANTGTSGVFDNRGIALKKTDWWVETGFTETIQLRHATTIYMMFGDYIAKIAACIATVLILSAIVKRVRRRKVKA